MFKNEKEEELKHEAAKAQPDENEKPDEPKTGETRPQGIKSGRTGVWRFFPDCRGQSAVEFAIILPVVLLLLLNFIEWGFVLWAQASYENAVRDGARAGVVIHDWDANYTARSDEVRDIVEDRLSSLPASLRQNISGRIAVEVIDDADGQTRSIKVSINAQPYTHITGFPGVLVPSTLSSSAEFRYEGGM